MVRLIINYKYQLIAEVPTLKKGMFEMGKWGAMLAMFDYFFLVFTGSASARTLSHFYVDHFLRVSLEILFTWIVQPYYNLKDLGLYEKPNWMVDHHCFPSIMATLRAGRRVALRAVAAVAAPCLTIPVISALPPWNPYCIHRRLVVYSKIEIK